MFYARGTEQLIKLMLFLPCGARWNVWIPTVNKYQVSLSSQPGKKKLRKLREKGDPKGGGIIYLRIIFAFTVRHGGYERWSYGVSEETIF